MRHPIAQSRTSGTAEQYPGTGKWCPNRDRGTAIDTPCRLDPLVSRSRPGSVRLGLRAGDRDEDFFETGRPPFGVLILPCIVFLYLVRAVVDSFGRLFKPFP